MLTPLSPPTELPEVHTAVVESAALNRQITGLYSVDCLERGVCGLPTRITLLVKSSYHPQPGDKIDFCRTGNLHKTSLLAQDGRTHQIVALDLGTDDDVETVIADVKDLMAELEAG